MKPRGFGVNSEGLRHGGKRITWRREGATTHSGCSGKYRFIVSITFPVMSTVTEES